MSFITSSIARKYTMAITGLFLVVFLIAHLVGNLSLLKCDGGEAFNVYAHFMKTNPIITIGEIVMFLGFIVHAIQGILLIRQNKAARPIGYAHKNVSDTKSKFSKVAGPFGIIIMVLLVWHLWDFFSYKYFADLRGGIEMMMVDGENIPDLAAIVYDELRETSHLIMYLVFMAVLSFHLHHGFQSAFQSLGINHKKYTPIIQKIGVAYAILIPLAFAMIPILIYFGFAGGSCCSAH